MRIFWVLFGPLLVAASERGSRGIRNYYTGKVSVGFENLDDAQPQLVPYAGESVQTPSPNGPVELEYGVPIIHSKKQRRRSSRELSGSQYKRSHAPNGRTIRPTPLTTTTTTTVAPPFPEEIETRDRAPPPGPMEIPPELRAAFGSFGIGGGAGNQPIFETKEITTEMPEETTTEALTTTTTEPRIKKQKRTHRRRYQTIQRIEPIVINVKDRPQEIPPELRQVFGVPDQTQVIGDGGETRPLFEEKFEHKRRIITHNPVSRISESKHDDVSEIADRIEEQLATSTHTLKKRRRKYRKLRKGSLEQSSTTTTTTTTISTTTTTTTPEPEVFDNEDDEEWEEVTDEEIEMRRQAEEEIVQQAAREKAEAKRLKALEEERLRELKEKKAELERLQEEIRRKKEELKEHERIQKSLLEKEKQQVEQAEVNRQETDRQALLEKKMQAETTSVRPKKMRPKSKKMELPPIPDSMRISETPVNHVEIEPPQFQRPQPLPPVQEEESFVDRLLGKDGPNFAARITPHVDSREKLVVDLKTRVHGLPSYNPETMVEDKTQKPTGYAKLNVLPAPEEEIISPDPNDSTFKGSWETTTVAPLTTIKPKKSNKQEKWSKETAKKYYEQYFKEWMANQTSTVPTTVPDQSGQKMGLKKRPKLLPSAEVTAPPTPVPKNFDTGVKPVPLMQAMYGDLPPGYHIGQQALPAPVQQPLSQRPTAPPPPQSSMQMPQGVPSSNPLQAMMAGLGGLGGLGGLPAGLPAQKGNLFGIVDPRMGGRGDLTYQQLNQLCVTIHGLARSFGIGDMRDFARMNCGMISGFYNDASCEQIEHVMEYCDAYFKDPEHRG